MFNEKIMTAQEAAKVVRSGDRVYVGTASSFAKNYLFQVVNLLWWLVETFVHITNLYFFALEFYHNGTCMSIN